MIIHQPETITQNDHTIIWTKIELKNHRENFPDILWCRIPSQFADGISLQSDAFLLPGLLAGMHFGEDIEVRGNVSPRLAYHLDEYQFLLHFRMPQDIRPVKVHYQNLKPLEADPRAVGSTFSGGVDSLFTLWKHLPENQPIAGYQVTHVLFINGFDILLKDKTTYGGLFDRYQRALSEFNIPLVPLQTNLVSVILPRLMYRLFYGPVLIGCAQVLAGLFKRFYVPSSRDYYQLKIRESSSTPLSDMLLSTETLDIVHHGATHRRVEKIEEISDWGFAQENMRVCQHSFLDGDFMNCSRCEKCVRTMIPIYALGAMDKFKTFSKPIRANQEGLWWARKYDLNKDYVPEIIPFVKRHKPDLVPWLRFAAVIGTARFWFLRLIPGFIKNRLKRYGYFVDSLKEQYAFDDPDMIQIIRSKTA